MASSSKTAAISTNGNNKSESDDEFRLAVGQNSDDYDSGSETDNSKDSDFELTSKPKKRKATTATTAATTTTHPDRNTTITTTRASSSHSSANKRKRTTTETGDEEEDAYYVLRCPLDRNCMTESSYIHNAPASIKGVFCEHPFKKRRAMEHFRACGLQGQISSERHIWENCCLKVVPDRKNTPVNAEWAEKHNRTLIRSAVKQAEGGKKEKERVEKEMEEEL
ncbi:hypothetical protein B0T20DRAFT_169025 [Sordaria brevicollis]|uniref:Uncharacterized protein n=1 Tax=Sordaria brevicollis TaxID=83679 RepID=A0AAE0PHU9_SORBR|nr:hypothetical protein B0T20DRAFT_169025 [Sordaria brevicollis]